MFGQNFAQICVDSFEEIEIGKNVRTERLLRSEIARVPEFRSTELGSMCQLV
jgi:hypothetical protein